MTETRFEEHVQKNRKAVLPENVQNWKYINQVSPQQAIFKNEKVNYEILKYK